MRHKLKILKAQNISNLKFYLSNKVISKYFTLNIELKFLMFIIINLKKAAYNLKKAYNLLFL